MALLTVREFKDNYKQWLNIAFDSMIHHVDSETLDNIKQITLETMHANGDSVATIAAAIAVDEAVVIDHINYINQITAAINTAVSQMKIYENIDDAGPAEGLKMLCFKIAKYHFYGDLKPKEDIWKGTIATDYREAIRTLEKRNNGKLAVGLKTKKHYLHSAFKSNERRY